MQDAKFSIYTADDASPKPLRGKLLARVFDGQTPLGHQLLDESLPLREALELALQNARSGVPLPKEEAGEAS